jgi:ribosomal protein L44E
MKNIKKYCNSCKRGTDYIVTKRIPGGARVLIGLFSFGFSEINNFNVYECSECGRAHDDFHDE